MATWLDREMHLNPHPKPYERPARYTRAMTLHPELSKLVELYPKEFLKAAPLGLAPLLIGRVQTGKTLAAVRILERVSSVVTVRFMSVPVELFELDLHKFKDTTQRIVYQLKTVPMLCLDDAFVVEPKSGAFQMLQAIVVARFDAMLPTMITGNLSLPAGKEFDTLGQHYGPLFARRLSDMSEGLRVILQ